ncbi:MAG: acyltransferase [Cellvibrionales bacterium]|jgi:peptidoglycan/LPS O-acetylase OafA/YrhL|nr:acyltransferase [Cellvibrionales bacterium]
MENSGSVVAGSKNKFRQDINALRAWAVVSVVLYHFGVPGFSGGFVGVDIFFVISGYLMTGIIVSGLEVGKFSVLNFYFARINRIIPALLLLCLMLLALGWFLLAPDDYEILAKHVKDTLLFVSNNTYRKESGYFDVLSHEKWLLHTWSLSVEWQFYLILPVFLYVAWLINKKRRWLFSVVFVVFLYSLVSCILKTNEAPTKAFYMIKYRYWEMLAGGLVYFLSDFLRDKISRGAGTVVYVASILGVLLPVFFVTSESHWPGYLALIPVLGAAAFILVNRSDLAVVNNKAVVWVGERSYSIYLWHWPAVVLLDYFQLLSSIYLVAFGVLGSFVVAELSYRLIENPFRKRRNSVVWVVPAIVLLASVGVCAMALGVIKLKGLPDRVDPVVVKLAAEKGNIDKGKSNCIYGENPAQGPLSCEYGKGEIKAVVLGDSHAIAIASAVQAALPERSGKILLWSRAACPFIKGVTAKIDQDCNDFVSWVLENIKSVPSNVPVILIQRSSLYVMGANEGVVGTGKVKPPIYFDQPYDYPAPEFLAQFRQHTLDTLCEVSKSRKLYWMKPTPELKIGVPQVMARAKMRNMDKRVFVSLAEYNERSQFVFSLMNDAKKDCGVQMLDPLPYLCDDKACYGDRDGWPVYFDDDHLSASGNKLLIPMFQRVFE